MSFDGEGLISWECVKTIDKAYCSQHIHTSFQIRMPYVKGMVHHVADVDIILTKSMFKGDGWLTDDHKTWEDYWGAFPKYRITTRYMSSMSARRSRSRPQISTISF